jgi:hypothetical protein
VYLLTPTDIPVVREETNLIKRTNCGPALTIGTETDVMEANADQELSGIVCERLNVPVRSPEAIDTCGVME